MIKSWRKITLYSPVLTGLVLSALFGTLANTQDGIGPCWRSAGGGVRQIVWLDKEPPVTAKIGVRSRAKVLWNRFTP
jgi:hypothetical protein